MRFVINELFYYAKWDKKFTTGLSTCIDQDESGLLDITARLRLITTSSFCNLLTSAKYLVCWLSNNSGCSFIIGSGERWGECWNFYG